MDQCGPVEGNQSDWDSENINAGQQGHSLEVLQYGLGGVIQVMDKIDEENKAIERLLDLHFV